MQILLIHQNFPAQFVHLAPALAAKGHQVRGLGQLREHRIKTAVVPTWSYPFDEEAGPRDSSTQASRLQQSIARGKAVLAFLGARKAEGYAPDLVLGHVGWGELLFLRHLWPEIPIIGYVEYFSGPDMPLNGFDPEFEKDPSETFADGVLMAGITRMYCAACDALLVPTAFQASVFPPDLAAKITVLHDGVDTDFSSPLPGRSLTLPDGHVIEDGDPVITFAARNLEPLRGYHRFMRALPEVLGARPDVRVVIAGNTHRGYGEDPPEPFSWRDIMLFEVGEQLDMTRLHYTGKLERDAYTDLLRISQAHCYLTYPYILSWSLIEAMSVGALVIGSKTAPVEEVVRHGENGLLVDFFDEAALARQLLDVLDDPARFRPLRAAARQTVLEHYDAARVCVPALIAFVEGFGGAG